MRSYSVALLVLLAVGAFCDMYFQNPRGCENRLNEANTNRNNNNRLFDSQDNAKGGYCWGPSMSYYEGSLLTLEWTNQHGCGKNRKLYCNIVIQYMCSHSDADPTVLVRDGQTTNTITDDDSGPTAVDANGNLLYGMHESRAFYVACKTRNRNQGLWINDRNLGGTDATRTRQNNNGDRHGYECPEERDYYPYWAPTQWRDIAILTHNVAWCDFYKAESQNVKSRFFCADSTGAQLPPINQIECSKSQGTWTEVPAWGLAAPDCVQTPYSRDNHLGNVGDIHNAYYNWTVPSHNDEDCIANNNCNCVLRIRYNISTSDMGASGNNPDVGFIDASSNGKLSPFSNNPVMTQDGAGHELAMDTTQFGRTFQDRSYVFHIKPRPSGISSSARIYNLNVRGKRGNIVQAYPATEYDYAPTYLEIRAGDYIHFQWTGCDTNPAGNAGEGTAQTDRSNVVQISDMGANLPATDAWIAANTPLFETQELRLYMAMLGQTDCLSMADLKTKNNNNQNNIQQDLQNCMKLNAASPYFDGGLVKMNKTSDFYFMSSRNNSYSNRGQKGELLVKPLLPTWAIAVVVVGAVFFVLSAGVAGLMLYAKSHPHSPIAETFSKF